MRKIILAFILGVIVGSGVFLVPKTLTRTPKTIGQMFVGRQDVYYAGYPGDVIELHVYWIKKRGNMSAVYSIRDLPKCLNLLAIVPSHEAVSGEVEKEKFIILLQLKGEGKCTADAKFVLRSGNVEVSMPIRIVAYGVKKGSKLRVYTSKVAEIGSEGDLNGSILEYEIYNPTNSSVYIRDVKIELPGIRIVNFSPIQIPPKTSRILTFILKDDRPIKTDIVLIRPLLLYSIGNETLEMPLEEYRFEIIPDYTDILGNTQVVVK
ncbi:hypothetical protein A3L04_05820 [Thermococcus chitonophagus]|uniref:Uncharacterized protein n=2 Tax=Thermococcus chitonophagus TaxID=54262 RepID=A0A160VSN5_9EURY|nr:hypothetical protein A3L04_05820 [Thermococcus chitonophagus]CUX77456.1 hypothetical protein CHITON_0677 [Thermococcus chitonophagus]